MPKSAQAFRTIREVADWLDVAAHVLRFWESKFHQIKPVKRAGGRRYYRPADMVLVGGIKVLLHDRGLTIRGVKKMISDEGIEAVTSLSPPIDELVDDASAEIINLDPSDASDAWAEDAAAEALGAESAPQETPSEPTPPQDEPTPAEGAAAPAAEAPVEASAPEATPPPTDTSSATDEAPAAALPITAPTEGRLGTLTAIAELPPAQRQAITPQIATLIALRDRMMAGPDAR